MREVCWEGLNFTYNLFTRSDNKIKDLREQINIDFLNSDEAKEYLYWMRQMDKNSETIFERGVELTGELAELKDLQEVFYKSSSIEFPEAPEVPEPFYEELDAELSI